MYIVVYIYVSIVRAWLIGPKDLLLLLLLSLFSHTSPLQNKRLQIKVYPTYIPFLLYIYIHHIFFLSFFSFLFFSFFLFFFFFFFLFFFFSFFFFLFSVFTCHSRPFGFSTLASHFFDCLKRSTS